MALGPRPFKAALKTLLEAEAAFTGVAVFTYTAKLDEVNARDYIVLGNVIGEVDRHRGGSDLTTYTIEGEGSIHQPAPDDAADRGWTLLSTIASVLFDNNTAGGAIDGRLATFNIDERVHDTGGRRVDIEFTIEVRDE